MKQEMEAWRNFLLEEETLASLENDGKKLAAKAVRNADKLSSEDKEALKKLQKLLPALVLVAADAPEINEPIGERIKGSGKKAKKLRIAARKEKILKTAELNPELDVRNLDSEQRAKYDAAKKDLQRGEYMSIQGDGGQTNLLLTKLDEIPGVRSIPGITAALTTLFQTDDLTILSALEALTSITGPLGI